MDAKPAAHAIATSLLASLLLLAVPAWAQISPTSLSGVVSASSGPVAGATVTLKNSATGQSLLFKTDGSGRYIAPELAPGKYEIAASAAGFNPQSAAITITSSAAQTRDFTLTPALSLGSLGFSQGQIQGNPKEQALLNKRSHMLQIHQKLGLITTGPLVATIVSGFLAHGRKSSPTSRDFHIALGSATAGLYFTTAYYAIFAPKIPGVKPRGPIRFHRAMAWIHGPGMILTPILGAMAESQLNQGERLHGAAKYHNDVAIVTAVAYGLALLSETKPNWIPGLGHDVASLFPFHGNHTRQALNSPSPAAVSAANARSDQLTPALGKVEAR
jgi:Carboxypeptidase regulatory-like domain